MSEYNTLKTCKMCEQQELVNSDDICASCGWEGKHEREDGDRICPNCETLNLVEESLTKWKCLKCQKTYDEEWLDEGIEIED